MYPYIHTSCFDKQVVHRLKKCYALVCVDLYKLACTRTRKNRQTKLLSIFLTSYIKNNIWKAISESSIYTQHVKIDRCVWCGCSSDLTRQGQYISINEIPITLIKDMNCPQSMFGDGIFPDHHVFTKPDILQNYNFKTICNLN